MTGRHHYDRKEISLFGKLNPSHTQAFATAVAMGSLVGSAMPLGIPNASGSQLFAAAQTRTAATTSADTEQAFSITANADSSTDTISDAELAALLDSAALDFDVELSKQTVRNTSSSAATSNATGTTYSAVPATGTRADMINYARQFQGVPYVWGHASPSGFDCSGLVSYVYAQYGYSIPHSSHSIIAQGYTQVSAAEAQPGDIMWWPGHVALYAGNGMLVHASPNKGVVEQAVYGSPVYLRVIN